MDRSRPRNPSRFAPVDAIPFVSVSLITTAGELRPPKPGNHWIVIVNTMRLPCLVCGEVFSYYISPDDHAHAVIVISEPIEFSPSGRKTKPKTLEEADLPDDCPIIAIEA